MLTAGQWTQRAAEWPPGETDREFVASVTGRVVEPGRFANRIAPPAPCTNRQPIDFEYVSFD